MTLMNLHDIEEEESARALPFVEPECAPHLLLSGVAVEMKPNLGVAELIGWQDCSTGSGGRYDCERRIVVRLVLPLPVAMALQKKLGAGASRTQCGIVSN